MVEHADTQGGRVREFLTLQEKSGPERVSHLVRHACAQGWQPKDDYDVFEIETSTVWDDPRARDHYQWMRLMFQQLHHLEEYLGSPVEVGAYWWHGTDLSPLGGFGARLRFSSYEGVADADLWEAAYCITGTEGEPAYSNLYAFPFKDGVNLGMADQRVWLFWLKPDCEYIEGVWRSQGWQPWDTAEQWAHVTEPGRLFFSLPAEDTVVTATPGAPVPVRFRMVEDSEGRARKRVTCSLHRVEQTARGDIVRMGTGDRWFSWDECETRMIDRTEASTLMETDVSVLTVPEGWQPGEYRVTLRVRCEFEDGQGQSDLLTPVAITIS